MINTNNRVYLAGPDVFYPDAMERAEFLKEQCARFGFEGVFPIDKSLILSDPINQEKNGYLIFNNNIHLIDGSWAMLVNMSPFRGPSMDTGTAFEMGYGRGTDVIIVGYTNARTEYKSRVKEDGYDVEDFKMIDNLMVHGAAGGNIFDTSVEALCWLSGLASKL